MSKRTVIVSGGELEKEFVLSVLKESDVNCIIAVDRGMEFLYENKIDPSYIVGDFDSVKEEVARYYRDETTVPIRQYDPEKDASDTEIAVRFAVTLGCQELLILGATGVRKTRSGNIFPYSRLEERFIDLTLRGRNIRSAIMC